MKSECISQKIKNCLMVCLDLYSVIFIEIGIIHRESNHMGRLSYIYRFRIFKDFVLIF